MWVHATGSFFVRILVKNGLVLFTHHFVFTPEVEYYDVDKVEYLVTWKLQVFDRTIISLSL